MTKSFITAIALFLAFAVSSAEAQESRDGPPESGIVQPSDDGPRRLGNLPNDQMRQFRMREACENDLPECDPRIRAQLEEERRNRMWMSAGIISVLLLAFLIALRESQRQRQKHKRDLAYHRRLGERIKKRWRDEESSPYRNHDPYKDSDPLGDE